MLFNHFDLEPPSLHLRRVLSRWYKRLRGIPPSLDDISVVRLIIDKHLSYEARRAGKGEWIVYRTSSHKYEGGKDCFVIESVRTGLSLPDALDMLVSFCPSCLTAKCLDFDSPVCVAKLIGHKFA